MTEQQKKQYIEFIMSFVQLMHEEGEVREAAVSVGLCALSAFIGVVCELPEDDEQQTPLAEFASDGLIYAIKKCYGEKEVQPIEE